MATPMTNADHQKVEKDKQTITLPQIANEVRMLAAACKNFRAQAQMLQSDVLAKMPQQPGLSNDPNAVPKYDE